MRAALAATMQRVRAGEPLPWGGQALPTRDDVVVTAVEEGRKAMQEEWGSRAMGDEAVRDEYWKEIVSCIADEEKALQLLNVQLAEAKLAKASADWEAWLGQAGEAAANDQRSEALIEAIDKGLPMKPTSRAVRDALNLVRMARIRWDGSRSAVSSELRLLQSELETKKQAAALASQVDDKQLEQTRQSGRLKGQVEALQTQVRDAISKEKALREQAIAAEEEAIKDRQMHFDAKQKFSELEWTVSELEEKLSRLKGAEEEEDEDEDEDEDRRKEPRCACNIM
jgi:hypothetical protein